MLPQSFCISLIKIMRFLQMGEKRIDDYALAALTIMIAESKPEEKEMMVKVVMNCLEDRER